MKKSIVTLATAIMLFTALALAGCTGGGGGSVKEPELAPFVSYEESAYLAAMGEQYNVEIIYFRSESPKRLDGKVSSPIVQKIRISYVPLKLGGIDEAVTFTYLGVTEKLSKSPIRYELFAEFETEFDLSAPPETTLALNIEGQEEHVGLAYVSADSMTAAEALNVATKELYDALKAEIDAGFAREISVKIIPDELGKNPFYYYVSFYASPDKFSAVLIDPVSKKVVAKKI